MSKIFDQKHIPSVFHNQTKYFFMEIINTFKQSITKNKKF